MKSVGGRPRKEIDPQLLERLAACGCTVNEIASVLGCNRRTLERRFSDAIEAGRLRGRSSLRHKQFQLALRGDKTMLIWLGKQYLAQTEKMVVTSAHIEQMLNEMFKTLHEHVKDKALAEQVTAEWQKIPLRVLYA